MIIKIAGVVICELFLWVLVKQYKSEYAVLIEIASVIFIFFAVFSQFEDLLEFFSNVLNRAGVSSDFIKSLIKALGIALVTQFTVELCRDNGENAVAAKIEFAGKILVLTVSLPILRGIAQLIYGIVENL